MRYTKFEIKVPQVNRHFVAKGGLDYSLPTAISLNETMIKDVNRTYGVFIKRWANEFKIDEGIINCFICTESGGKNVGANRFNATGLMQVTPNTVYETITKWNTMVGVPLTERTKSFLNSKVSSTSKWSSNRQPSTSETQQILSKLTDVEYNIAVGTATIRWMLEGFAKLGSADLYKVMVAYNAGFYGTRNRIKDMTIEQILASTSVPSESKGYLLKMLGVKGFMDLYYNIMDM
jgi:hypothetical protein